MNENFIEVLYFFSMMMCFPISLLVAYFLWGETPRQWIEVFGIVGIIAVVLFVLSVIYVYGVKEKK